MGDLYHISISYCLVQTLAWTWPGIQGRAGGHSHSHQLGRITPPVLGLQDVGTEVHIANGQWGIPSMKVPGARIGQAEVKNPKSSVESFVEPRRSEISWFLMVFAFMTSKRFPCWLDDHSYIPNSWQVVDFTCSFCWVNPVVYQPVHFVG